MNVLILTDLEGVVGVTTMESVFRDGPGFTEAYANLARDINVAIDGAFAGGATEVQVIDGHGARGLDTSLIDPRARCVHVLTYVHGPYDAMILVGYHAMAGTQNAFLDHTQSSGSWFDYRVNGRSSGEIAQAAMTAAANNAPVILVTGDEAVVAEAHNFFGEIETVAVKRGVGRNSCVSYDHQESRQRIRDAAERAVRRLKEKPESFPLYKPALPAEMLLTFMRADYADEVMKRCPWLERMDARTVRKVFDDYRNCLP